MWCVKWISAQPRPKNCHYSKPPDSSYALIKKHIHHIHLIHQLVGKPSGKRTAFANGQAQCGLGFVVGSVFNKSRQARPQTEIAVLSALELPRRSSLRR
jgi:predicted dehydrogenase